MRTGTRRSRTGGKLAHFLLVRNLRNVCPTTFVQKLPTLGECREQTESPALSIFKTARRTAAATQNEESEPIEQHGTFSNSTRYI